MKRNDGDFGLASAPSEEAAVIIPESYYPLPVIGLIDDIIMVENHQGASWSQLIATLYRNKTSV